MRKKFYYIDEDYINTIQKIDKKVLLNKSLNRKRPYLGIIYLINDITYFIPIASFKEKHNNIKNSQIDIVKIYDKNNKGIAILQLNNMIPVPLNKVHLLDIKKLKSSNNKDDIDYANLLQKELDFINKKEIIEIINHKINKLRKIYKQQRNIQIINRCCDWDKIEEFCNNFK